MDSFTHSLSHIDIQINPVIIDISDTKVQRLKKNMAFIKAQKMNSIATSKAVKKIIDRL